MKPDSVNHTLIVNYLFGALPEEDLERFEARYLQDETLFEELQEIEDELIDDYASGALKTDQRSSFEQYFLRSTQRREKVEFARSMTELAVAWKSEAAASTDSEAELEESNARRTSFLKYWSRPVPSWRQWAAIAAAVLVAVGAGTLWLRNRELRRQLIVAEASAAKLRQDAEVQSALATETQAQLFAEQQQTQKIEDQFEQLQKSFSNEARKVVVTAFLGVEYLAQGTRGGGEKKVKTLEVPANARMLRLGVEFEKSRFEAFTITLRQNDGSAVWKRGGLKARAIGDKQRITLTIPAESLPAGNYDLSVSGVPPEGDAELVGHYYLRLQRK
jgi:hypothetical protein